MAKLDAKEHAIIRKERNARYANSQLSSRVKVLSEDAEKKMIMEQRIQRVRFYLSVRRKMGFPLLPKSK